MKVVKWIQLLQTLCFMFNILLWPDWKCLGFVYEKALLTRVLFFTWTHMPAACEYECRQFTLRHSPFHTCTPGSHISTDVNPGFCCLKITPLSLCNLCRPLSCHGKRSVVAHAWQRRITGLYEQDEQHLSGLQIIFLCIHLYHNSWLAVSRLFFVCQMSLLLRQWTSEHECRALPK